MLPLLLLHQLFLPATASSAVPLFSSCNGGLRCEGTAVCRFNVCLPPTNPVPVYAHGNRTFTVQPNQNPKPPGVATVRPVMQNIIVQAPRMTVTAVSCRPSCLGQASCVQGACKCPMGVFYSPLAGCVSASSGRPILAVPVAPMLPGDKCDPGVECTGGSVCSLGICSCPPELVQQGGVCVSSAVLGLPHRGLPGYQ